MAVQIPVDAGMIHEILDKVDVPRGKSSSDNLPMFPEGRVRWLASKYLRIRTLMAELRNARQGCPNLHPFTEDCGCEPDNLCGDCYQKEQYAISKLLVEVPS